MENTHKNQINDDMRKFLRMLIIKRMILKAHVFIFIAINLLLYILNNPKIMELSDYQWWLWAITGWGLILSFHIYIYFTKKLGGPLKLNVFSFISVNLYLFFIDWYSNFEISWAWIPAFSWFIILIIHYIITRELLVKSSDLEIYGVMISDDSSRVLINVECSKSSISSQLKMSEDKIEMVPMFFNALQSFSDEINIQGCNSLELNGKNLQLISVRKNNLTITGFISPQSKPVMARMYFETIIGNFIPQYNQKKAKWDVTGDSSLFSDYIPVLLKQIHEIK